MRSMALSGAEYLIAVITAFPLFFVTTLFRGSFLINAARMFVGSFNVEMTAYP